MMPPSPRPCVCKGWIAPADSGREAITYAVATHNETDRHLAWRFRQDRAGQITGPESPAESVIRILGIPVPSVRAARSIDVEPIIPEDELRIVMDGTR